MSPEVDLVGVTVSAIAAAKQIPEAFLREQGWRDDAYRHPELGQVDAVAMPYWIDQVGGRRAYVRRRISLAGSDKFRQPRGQSPDELYGRWRLGSTTDSWCLLVEGETDAVTAWHAGLPAIAVPGASTWCDTWADQLAGFDVLYVVQEPDQGGTTLLERLARTPLQPRLNAVRLIAPDPDAVSWISEPTTAIKDLSELWVATGAQPEAFRDALAAAIADAVPVETPPPLPATREEQRRAALDAEMTDLVEDLETRGELDPKAAMFMRASDAVAPADVDDWDYVGWLRRRALAVLASTEGLGKTWCALEASIRGATGQGPVFGHFAVGEPMVIAYVDEENGEAELYRREEAILGALGLERTDLGLMYRVSFAGVHLGRESGQQWLRDQLRGIRPRVVFLDTAGLMVDDEWGAPLKDAVRFLRSLIVELDCSIVLLVHLVKPGRDRPSGAPAHGGSISDVMGQWTRHADVVMTLSDLGADRLKLTLRKRVPHADLVLARQGALWMVVADLADVAPGPRVEDQVLRAIAAGAGTADDIVEGLAGAVRRRTVFNVVRRLRTDGLVAGGTPYQLTDAGLEAVG